MTDIDTTIDADDLTWEDPPAIERKQGQGKVQRFVNALKQRPGQWAVYNRAGKAASGSAYAKSHPGTQWSTRANGDDTYTVRARYVGENFEHVGEDDPNPPRGMKRELQGQDQGDKPAAKAPARKAPAKKAAARKA